MVCLSPWFFGSTGTEFESLLYAGVALLLGLWSARMLLEDQLSWKSCPVTVCLAGLILLAVWQLVPLPHDLLVRLSPATVRLYDRLLPAQTEVLPFGEVREAPNPLPGSTLSLYPGRTRQELIRLLAVFALFIVVRNNVASPGSLRRLSLAALLNGALLALFALFQFFSSSADTVYWTVASPGTVFGPFVCRNHYAFYLNLCIGLGVGLFIWRDKVREQETEKDWERDRMRAPGARSRSETLPSSHVPPLSSLRALLQDPPALWMIGGLALSISSVLFCASRGGIVALLSGWIVFLLINVWRSASFRKIGALLLTLSLVLGLVTWFGLGRVQARLATLWGSEILKESRLVLWSRVLPLVKEFPVWGTGYGTFQYLEPLYRVDPTNEQVCSNAENDYLEGFIEGGLVRLGLSVLSAGLIFWFGYRALAGPGRVRGVSALAMGALFAFTTMVVQSFVDFGLHIPAIAVFATILSAQLCGAGASTKGEPGRAGVYRLRLWGLAPLTGAIVAGILALLIGYEGLRMYQVERLRLSATSRDPAGGALDRIDRLEAAARRAPESARLQLELSLAHYDVYRERREKLRITDQLSGLLQVMCDVLPARFPLVSLHPALNIAPASILMSAARTALSTAEDTRVTREHLVPALRSFMQARDLCPLLPEPERYLADNSEEFERADERITYLERAALLVPYDPGLWYACGEELLPKQPEEACKKWRRSLELSDTYLRPILEQSIARLGPEEIRDQVLPKEPKILLVAALQLYPEATPKRQMFLEPALALLEKPQVSNRAEDLHLKAVIYCALGQSAEALTIYPTALGLQPRELTWRLEFAQLLQEQKHLQRARRELLTVLSQQPDHAPARELLAVVERQIAEGH